MDATRSSETTIFTKPTRHHIPEDGFLHSRRRENLKSYIHVLFNRYWYISLILFSFSCSCPIVDFLLLLPCPILYSFSYSEIWWSGYHVFEEKGNRVRNVPSWGFSVQVYCHFNAVRNIMHLLRWHTAYKIDDRTPIEGSICRNVSLNILYLYFQSPGHAGQQTAPWRLTVTSGVTWPVQSTHSADV
jgi:hypothetical protein